MLTGLRFWLIVDLITHREEGAATLVVIHVDTLAAGSKLLPFNGAFLQPRFSTLCLGTFSRSWHQITQMCPNGLPSGIPSHRTSANYYTLFRFFRTLMDLAFF